MRGVLFDKDGTLIDFDATWLPLYRDAAALLAEGDAMRAEEMLARSGYDPATETFKAGSLLTVGTTDQMVAEWRPDLTESEGAAMIRRLDDMFAAGAVSNLAPITNLGGLFTRLKRDGFHIGIATNDATASAVECFGHLGLVSELDFITGYDGVKCPKPAADMALAFAQACGIEPSDIVVVGDNVHDLEMGVAAGAGFNIGVLSGTSKPADFKGVADAVLASVAELPDMLAARFPPKQQGA